METSSLTEREIQYALRNLDYVDPAKKAEMLSLLEERERLVGIQEARAHFLPFVRRVWPEVILGAHHTLMAEAFERLLNGTSNRLIINIAPRHSKSEMTSWLLPLWYIGKNPRAKIMQCMNTQDLASGFGRRVRNVISKEAIATDKKGYDPYHEIFPDLDISKDSGAASHWHTNTEAEYYGVGIGGKIAGRGANLLIIDDPHSEQEAKQAENDPSVFDNVYDWYVYGPRQRLQPAASICVIQTRWSKRDLTGQLIKKMQSSDSAVKDRWEVIEFPAILDEGQETERSLWPGYWPLPILQATRDALPVQAWQAQYQQRPTSESAAIFKRDNWRIWGRDTDIDLALGKSSCPHPSLRRAWEDRSPPSCSFIIQSWDCASSKNERSHPNAFTEWGVFTIEDPATGREISNIILLSSFQKRMEFPELKAKAKQFYEEGRPDVLLVENKSAGMQLLQEFRSMGIPAEDFSGSSRGSKGLPNDKIARANSVSDVFASRYVWAPETRFADEVITQMAEFPNSDADDLVDSTVQAMIRFRTGGFIRTANDEADDDEDRPRARRKRYY